MQLRAVCTDEQKLCSKNEKVYKFHKMDAKVECSKETGRDLIRISTIALHCATKF